MLSILEKKNGGVLQDGAHAEGAVTMAAGVYDSGERWGAQN